MTDIAHKPKRIWRVVLVLSLALNLVVIGIGVGFATRFHARNDAPPPAVFGSVYLRALSHESRRSLGDEMRMTRKDHAQKHGRNSENNYGYDRAIQILNATPFEPQALRAIMLEQEKVSSEHLAEARDLLLNHLTQMDDDDRQEYAEEIVEILNRRKR